jgi:hypothetical protein
VFISLLALLTKHKCHIHKILVELHISILYQYFVELLATLIGQKEACHGTGPMIGQETVITLH